MGYLVFARKWRPMLFKDVVGQEHTTRTLENVISSNRIAHAYLFSGTRGVGKTTIARIFAKALNCEDTTSAEPCNQCSSCKDITEGRSLDVLEIDGASNRGIEDIRDIRERTRYASANGRYKIYIIDEVHMLTKEAFNALLKTLEEPPEKVLFIFATTEPNKVPATILSRCQQFDFRPIATDRIRETLNTLAQAEGATLDNEALWLLAHKADGSLRDGLSLLDQAIAYSGNEVTSKSVVAMLGLVEKDILFGIVEHILDRRLDKAIEVINALIDRGYDWGSFLDDLLEHLRNVLLVYSSRKGVIPIGVPERDVQEYRAQAGRTSQADLLKMLQIVMEAAYTIKRSTQPRFLLEIMLTRLVELESSLRVETLLGRLETLQSGLPAAPVQQSVAPQKQKRVTETLVVSPPPPPISAAPPTYAAPPPPPPSTPLPSPPSTPPPSQSTSVSAPPLPVPAVASAETEQVQLGALSAENIQEYWLHIIAAVKNKKTMLGGLLEVGELTDFDASKIVLSFPKNMSIHLDMAKKYKAIIEQEILAVTGASLKIAFALINKVAPKPVVEKKTEITKTSGIDSEALYKSDPMIGEIATLFNGEIIPPRR